MTILKLIKYPGAKTTLIPQISEIFRDSGRQNFIDVFGGSGVVPLNIEARSIVYNDLNKELYNLFSVVKKEPAELLKRLRYWTRTRDDFIRYGEVLHDFGPINVDEIDRALRTLYQFTIGFGGMGSTYRTRKEKSSYSTLSRVVTNFGELSSRISGWKIENLDFANVIEKYDSEDSFFFCDPPYSSKEWYEFGFGSDELGRLKDITDHLRGKYLLSFDSNDETARRFFGKPNLIIEQDNQNGRKEKTTVLRRFSFYHNLE